MVWVMVLKKPHQKELLLISTILSLILLFGTISTSFSASTTKDIPTDGWDKTSSDTYDYYFTDRWGRTKYAGQVYYHHYLDKVEESYSNYDLYAIQIYTDFSPGAAQDINHQAWVGAEVEINLKSSLLHIDERKPDSTTGEFTYGTQISMDSEGTVTYSQYSEYTRNEISISVGVDHNDGGFVNWELDPTVQQHEAHDFYFTALVMAEPGAAADYDISFHSTWEGGYFYTVDRSDTVSIYYDPFGGGGGDGCPRLSVYDGNNYVEEGFLDIHAYSDVRRAYELTSKPKAMDDKYLLRLTEHPETISHIDQVQLYAVLANASEMKLPLVSATHSNDGNVKQELLLSDNLRVIEKGAEHVDGSSEYIDLKFIAKPKLNIQEFIFTIEGYNPERK